MLDHSLNTEGLIYDGLAVADTFDFQMLYRDIRESIQDIPCGRGVHVIAEDDLVDSIQQSLLIQIIQHGIQFVRVRILTVHHYHSTIAVFQKVIDTFLGQIAGIGYLTQIREAVLVGLVEQCGELLVVEQMLP